jgi:hypothetical protein
MLKAIDLPLWGGAMRCQKRGVHEGSADGPAQNNGGASFSLQRRLQPASVANFGMFFNGAVVTRRM